MTWLPVVLVVSYGICLLLWAWGAMKEPRPGPTDASWCGECGTSDDPCRCELGTPVVPELIDGSGDAGTLEP